MKPRRDRIIAACKYFIGFIDTSEKWESERTKNYIKAFIELLTDEWNGTTDTAELVAVQERINETNKTN
jgi:hypothetical protein